MAIALAVAIGGVAIAYAVFSGDDKAGPGDEPTPTTSAPVTSEPPTTEPPGDGEAACGAEVPDAAKDAAGRKDMFSEPPEMQIDESKTYTATIQTSCGTMVAELYPKDAPITVNSFVFLAREGFFDGIIFHRVIKDFVIQGGDPTGTGTGGPGYEFEDELDNGHKYEVGTLAMANSGANTNGSQFFVITGPQGVALPNNYSIFGKVTEGVEAALEIGNLKTDSGDKPEQTAYIEKITIEEK